MRTTLLRWSLLTATAICISGTNAQDGYITNASLPRYIKANMNYSLSMWVKNASSTYITSFSVRWRLDGGSWNNGTTVNITAPGLGSGNYYMNHTHVTPLNTTQGAHTLELNVVVVGDVDPSNNSVIIDFTALSTYSDKVVLLEARTETWCPNCPNSNEETNELMIVPEYAVGKFHLSDALNDCPECITYFNGQYGVNFTPAGMMEMGEYDSYTANAAYTGWGPAMSSRADGVSPVELTMTSSVNWTTRVLTVTITANFSYVVPGGAFKLNTYVLEDNVPGPQQNGSPNYIHNAVMRAMLGGATSTTGVIPAVPVVGTTYTHTYTYTVPSGFKIGDLELIGVVEHDLGASGRYTLNAVKGSASPVGIADLAKDDRVVVQPNPFNEQLAVTVSGLSGAAHMELVAMDGRVVTTRDLYLNSGSPTRIDVDGAPLRPGAYVVRIYTEQGTVQRNVIKVN